MVPTFYQLLISVLKGGWMGRHHSDWWQETEAEIMSLCQQTPKLGSELHLWEKLMVGISASSCCFASEIWNASISENCRILEMIKILGIISSFSLMNQRPLKLLCPKQNSKSSSTELAFFQCSQSMDNIIIYWVIPSKNQGPILEDMISFNFKTNSPPSAVYSVSWISLLSVGLIQPNITSWLVYYSSLTFFYFLVIYSKFSTNLFPTQIWQNFIL